jgi:hypothetical protein
MTTTTESQITSGKAESIDTPEFRELLKKYHHSTTWDTKLIAHIEAVREKDRQIAFAEGMKAPDSAYTQLIADRDHWKAKWEANRAGREYAELSDKELSDPEYMRAYVEGCQESFAEMLAARQAPDAGLIAAAVEMIRERGVLSTRVNGSVMTRADIAGALAILSPAQQEPASPIADFITSQKPLDADIAKVISDNAFDLYATDEAASATDAGQELKNCFCGGKPVIQKLHDGWQNWIECGDCSNETARKGTLEQAKEEWQRIATPAQATPEGGHIEPWENREAPEGSINAMLAEISEYRSLAASQQAAEPVIYVRKCDIDGTFHGGLVQGYKVAEGYWNVPLYRAAPLQQVEKDN